MNRLPSSPISYATFVILGVAVVNPIAAFAADSESLPRYDLSPGQVFEYKGSSSFEYEGGSHGTDSAWTVWVAGENTNGSWPIVVRQSSQFFQKTKDGQNLHSGDPMVNYVRFNLTPNGETDYKRDLLVQVSPASLMPLFPTDAAAVREGWTSDDTWDDMTHEYTAEHADGAFVVTDRVHTVFDEIYLTSLEQRFVIGETGLPTMITSKSTQGYGFDGKGSGKTELKETHELSAKELEAFLGASEAFFSAQHAFSDGFLEMQSKPVDQFDSIAKTITAKLDAARDHVAGTPFEAALDELRSQVEQNVKYGRETAEKRAGIIGKPGPEWETTDLENEPWSTDSLRGNVAVLDFWYRGCGWCIRAMPSLNRLAEHYEDKPVHILGMNTDQNKQDAHFVIEKMGLTYPTLRAKPIGLDIPNEYGVTGYPTLVVLDQEGVVREFHVGYSATLFEDLSEIIDGLLE